MNHVHGRKRLPVEPILVALGGGGGGVGRSTLAVEVARQLARKGRKTLVVDADLAHPNLHLRLGKRPPAYPPHASPDALRIADLIEAGERNQPSSVSLVGLAGWPQDGSDLDARKCARALRGLDFDYVFIDLPPRLLEFDAQLFCCVDVPVLVSTSEPVTVMKTTHDLRRILAAAMQVSPSSDEIEDAVNDTFVGLPLEFGREDLDAHADRMGTTDVLSDVRTSFTPYLLLNRTRETAERELGQVICLAWHYLLGVRPRYLGAIDHDDRRWFHLRQGNLVPPLGSDDGTGVQIEELARRISEIANLDKEQPRKPFDEVRTPTELLGVSPEAEPLEVRQTYRKLWEGFRRDSCVTGQLVARPLRERIVQDLEGANKELQTWLAERSLTGNTAEVPSLARRQGRHAPGKRVSEARLARDLSRRELSLRTKIGVRYLEAIEAFEIDALPRPVYLRGYLREIARALALDEDELLDEYLTALSEAKAAAILSRDTSGKVRLD